MTDNSKLFTALVKAQAAMENPVKDSQNPHLKNKYSSLAAVLDTCRQPLTSNGIALYQTASIAPDMPSHVIVTSMLIHGESGESISDSLPIPLAQNTAQGIGSAITYGRRYMLLAQLGLAPGDEEDDDGNKASNRTQQPQQAQRQPVRQLPAPATNGAQHRQPAPEVKELAASVNATITTVESFDDIPNATTSDALLATEATNIATELHSPPAAQAWAIENGYCSNEHHARNRWKVLSEKKFNNKVDQRNLKAVILAYVADCLSKPKAQIEQPEAA